MSGQLHVIPHDDAVEHDTRYWNACICGPNVKAEKGAEGYTIIVTHHSLDGREQHE